MLLAFFPFLAWFKNYSLSTLRADLVAGLTVALVLIPQSMAYAQLAGLPAYYGLYASFLPPMVAALFGSSSQLATGPVAIVSLMTATALQPLATAGSQAFIAYAMFLALVVGIFQFALGLLRLGAIVNFLSHPVVNGFTNAAALIIASSQLSKLFGVSVDSREHHYETVLDVLAAAKDQTHWPTFWIGVLAFAIMYGLKRLNRKIPNVLVAVVATTAIAWYTGFENNVTVSLSSVADPGARELIEEFNRVLAKIDEDAERKVDRVARIAKSEEEHGPNSVTTKTLEHELALFDLDIEELTEKSRHLRARLRAHAFVAVAGTDRSPEFHFRESLPGGVDSDGRVWRMRVGRSPLKPEAIQFLGGGEVVGSIPRGLPAFKAPVMEFGLFFRLFTMAATISLLGFMEAISIAKAMAARMGQRLDYNQELIGQGLANMVGAFSQSYPVSGSFSRSAVNHQTGALTGMSSVFSSCVVVISLLFLTPLLYHLPQSVLAAIIMMAVIGLVNVRGFLHAWHAQWYDGLISVITFVATLLFAPHLDRGILLGIVLSLGLYLLRNMKPRIAKLSKYTDTTYRNAERLGLKECDYIAVIRFEGSLFFANVNYLEEVVLERIATMPKLKYLLIVGNGINEMDASGEEMLSRLIARVREAGYDLHMSGLNDSVLDVMRRTGLYEVLGEDHLFRNATMAVEAIHSKAHEYSEEVICPLMVPCFKGLPVSETGKHKHKF